MMNLELIQLTIEGLAAKVTILEKRNQKLIKRIKKIERRDILSLSVDVPKQIKEDVLLDTKEVLSILGISYNTLRSIINKKLISTIRINQRRVRYSKKAIYAYIESKSH